LLQGKRHFFAVRLFLFENTNIRKSKRMDMELRVRNHDIGLFSPTFQERINSALQVTESPANVGIAANSCAAPVLAECPSATPRYPDSEEVRATLSRMEEEAGRQSVEIVEIHSGLNELRVARLLGLLE
jgi:hypothetical protein